MHTAPTSASAPDAQRVATVVGKIDRRAGSGLIRACQRAQIRPMTVVNAGRYGYVVIGKEGAPLFARGAGRETEYTTDPSLFGRSWGRSAIEACRNAICDPGISRRILRWSEREK